MVERGVVVHGVCSNDDQLSSAHRDRVLWKTRLRVGGGKSHMVNKIGRSISAWRSGSVPKVKNKV